jgi:hypothetical protein
MNLTPQQRKAIWICLALVVASYVIRSVMNFAQQQEYMRQQFIRAQQRQAKAQAEAKAKAKAKAEKDAADRAAKAAAAKAAAVAKAAPALPKPEKPVSYAGIWRGQTTVERRGLCTLRIELHETEPSKYQGYSSLVCADFAPLMKPKERVNRAAAIKNRMNPEAAVISGALENGAIAFHVDKTIGADANGCAATSFTLTPFGKNEFAAEWQEATCKGGRVMLQKARK